MAIRPIKKAISDHYGIKVHSISSNIKKTKPTLTPNGKFKKYTITVYIKTE